MKRILAICLLAFAAQLSAGEQPKQPAPAAGQPQVNVTQTVAGGRTIKVITDQEIIKKIKAALAPGFFSSGYPLVTYDVYNGKVTLGGTVESADDKTKADNLVKGLEGVQEVVSNIKVVKAEVKK